jgi:hypothetical protein
MQYEGEVQPCPDPFHEQVTEMNTAKKVEAHRRWLAAAQSGFKERIR